MTSDEARKITQEALCGGQTQTMSAIFDKIREAASRGQAHIYLEDSSLTECEQLRRLGYEIIEYHDEDDFGSWMVEVIW